MRVVMLDPSGADRLDRIRPYLPQGWEIDTTSSRHPDEQKAALLGADFGITGDVPVTAEMMAVEGLRAIHKWGVGYDNIDLDAARKHNVRVLRTTGSNSITVAETTLGLILAVNRNIVRGHVGILNGKWRKGELSPTSMRLSGKTVGIIGMGYIGKALAKLLKGFDCKIIYTKRSPLTAPEEAEAGISFAPLDQLLRTSDVVTLNCELNASTRNLIDREALALMRPDAILVNAARGGVMVEEDVAEAIREGRLRGAGVDVFAIEPLQSDNPLIGLDGVITTPHIAATSADGFAPSISRMLSNLQAIAEGKEPNPIDVLV